MIVVGTSRLTSDFVVDGLARWWEDRRRSYPKVKKLVIDRDNGPEISSRRTQFIKHLVEFADKYKYEQNMQMNKQEITHGEARLQRSKTLPKWSVVITPQGR
jgi:hypothetical protein